MQTITSKELAKNNDKSILILDIRQADKFRDRHVHGSKNIDVYNEIWEGNFDDVKKKLSQLPKNIQSYRFHKNTRQQPKPLGAKHYNCLRPEKCFVFQYRRQLRVA